MKGDFYMSNLQRDIETAFYILKTRECNDTYKLYPWSNERIFNYYKYYDLTNKKAMCITGSGDHALYSIAAGASEVDCVDKNFLCKYYQALKVALILTYDEKYFFEHIKGKGKILLINKNNLNDIKEFLDDEMFIFWNELMNSSVFRKRKRLFRDDGFPTKFSLDYEDLKEKLLTAKIKYYDDDIKDFIDNKKEEYDAIFLSNLLEWQCAYSDIIVSNCLKALKENGVLYDAIINRQLEYEELYEGFEKKIQPEFLQPRLKCTGKGINVYRKK